MEQIKSNNFKTIVIMENLINKVKNIFSKPEETTKEEKRVAEEKKEAKINLTDGFTLDAINTKEFVQWLKQDIKERVADQKIAKRDRKDVNHPCPKERVYSVYKAAENVIQNRQDLRFRYFIYYLLRKVKDFKWDLYKATKTWSGGFCIDYDYTLTEYMFHNTCKIDKILSNHDNWYYVQGQILRIIKDYVDSTKNS